MEFALLQCLARSRIDDLVRESARRRSLRADMPRARPFRRELGRAIRAIGYAALTLGDALAESK